ncbi:MAG: protein-glutamate O-methyltransferase CheR [Candidatus Bathyarchaeota archaeon]|nr:protein-glutamate O-methyltransferase CheR [Candidatus Bathyarchaeota archaeon]
MAQVEVGSVEAYLENSAYSKVKRMLYEAVGLDCSGYRDEYLRRRFEIRLRVTGCVSFGRYITYLRHHPEEYACLLNDLTVNFTSFFRDSDVYDYLEKKILPELLSKGKPVRIWSAGCASGEEPYSLAMLIHRVLGGKVTGGAASIYASDIDADALSKAKRGVYSTRQLGGVDAACLERFFKPEGEGFFEVRDEVKSLIRFGKFDLMQKPLQMNLDLILCRNVMIYFSRERQQQVHMNFFHALREGGYFITGKSEILQGQPAQVFSVVEPVVRLYQKNTKANPS